MRPQVLADKKVRLSQQIENLKVDIQYLIDKKKGLSQANSVRFADEIKRLETDKKQKMGQLKRFGEELKEIHKKEREQNKKANEIRMTSQAVDSIEFHKAKKKNDVESMTKAKRDKEQRDRAQKVYLDYLETDEKYAKVDPKDVPGALFLHESVLDAYGLCPHVEINVEDANENTTVTTSTKRKDWLNQQKDKGEVYYNLYNMVYKGAELDNIITSVQQNEDKIVQFAKSILTESQYEIFEKVGDILKGYFDCGIKTKKIKENYKRAIHYLSILQAETFVSFYKYYATKYKSDIEINDISVDEDYTLEETQLKVKMRLFNQEIFQEHLDAYNTAFQNLEQRNKYITNTLNTLKNELYMFLTKQKDFARVGTMGKKMATQPGKYFKRWTVLSDKERNERFESYANFYVERYMVQEGLITSEEKHVIALELAKLLQEKYKEKRMVYRDFVWSTKLGIIERVKILRYDREKKEFVLNYSKKQPSKDAMLAKKKLSMRTIFTKDNERVINDHILSFIVSSNGRDQQALHTKESMQLCIDKLKERLKKKTLTNEDKAKFTLKYNEMLSIIRENNEN